MSDRLAGTLAPPEDRPSTEYAIARWGERPREPPHTQVCRSRSGFYNSPIAF